MRRYVLALAILSAVLTLSGCVIIDFLYEVEYSEVSTTGEVTHITVQYSFDATRASASGSWDSYTNAAIGSALPGANTDITYDQATRTYSVSYTSMDGNLALSLIVQMDENEQNVLYVYAYRLMDKEIETIEAANIPKRENPNDDDGMSYYLDNTTVYRVLQGEACARVIALTSIDNGAVPEPNWVTSFSCGGTSYLEVAIRR